MPCKYLLKFSLIFADVELGVCGKELNSDIPFAHGYPQQVAMMIMMMVILIIVIMMMMMDRDLVIDIH